MVPGHIVYISVRLRVNMTWVTAVVGLIGAWGLLAGVVLLGREARTQPARGKGAGDDTEGVTLECDSRVLVGATPVYTGAVMAYIARALGGIIDPF